MMKKKEKRKKSFAQHQGLSQKFSKPAAVAQSCQVRPVLTHEQHNFCKQFWGNKMQNHVPYPTPLIVLEMSNKEGVVVDNVFCLSSICMLDPENSKNIIFSPWGRGNIQINVVQPIRASEQSTCLFWSN